MKTLIIAEAGVNHNGELDLAMRLVEAAARAGADVVKFQTFNADRLVTRAAPKAGYQTAVTDPQESQHAMIRKLELKREMHASLIAECEMRRIKFMSSAFDLESIDLLAELGLDTFKIPSGELTNLPYLRRIGGYGKPVLLSTGMATLDEVRAALDVLERSGSPRSSVTVLQCTTEYPAAAADVNLRAMLTIRDELGVSVGYSDHTRGIEIPIAAVALGATVIEKHFTLDRNLLGPDHQASLEPDELKAMVNAIRNVEAALGDGIKKPTSAENKNKTAARKSLVAATSIREGEAFTEFNLAVKRPGSGLSPMSWDNVIGRIARRAFTPDELIEL